MRVRAGPVTGTLEKAVWKAAFSGPRSILIAAPGRFGEFLSLGRGPSSPTATGRAATDRSHSPWRLTHASRERAADDRSGYLRPAQRPLRPAARRFLGPFARRLDRRRGQGGRHL